VGDGAFTPEVWVRSASHPYHFFRFAFIFWYSRAAPKRQRTAVSSVPGMGMNKSEKKMNRNK
jgi:hypothetical protein